jgi:hippurate hydrolase
MDALPITEANTFAHGSRHPGRMHACGHDGHTTMLLGAAQYLAESRRFDGTVVLIFQPAEENEGGGRVQALQTITSRNIAAADAAVVSVTQFHGGEAWNVIPARVVLRGSLRYFRDEVRHTIHGRLQSLCAGVAAAHGAQAELRILPGYPPTVNSAAEAATAAAAMAAVVGAERVDTHLPPTMGAEDFAYMLQARPGAYGWIGNGPGTGGCLLHNPRYDFNDALLAIGASYWATLVERVLAPKPACLNQPT